MTFTSKTLKTLLLKSLNMVDIVKVLKEMKPEIDVLIEKYIPRRFDESTIEFIAGKPRYKYHVESLQKAIADPIWEFLDRGGKRWRPALFLLIVEALGGDREKLKDFCIVPELVHNGTLLIDDVEDNSDFRRGKPCSHKIFGMDIALNASNALYYLPLIVFIKKQNELEAETLVEAYETYVQEMIRISFGQAMDIAWHRGIAGADEIDEGEYLQMCAYKTGTLARMAAKLAAVLCGAKKEEVEKIGKFAETIGVAFQIQDDILNLIGEEKYGKEIGGDISEGKRTLMVIHTLQNASEEDKRRLIEILNMHTKDQALINEAIDIMKRYGAIGYAKKRAKEIMEEAWQDVEPILKEGEAKEKLRAFAEFLINREY